MKMTPSSPTVPSPCLHREISNAPIKFDAKLTNVIDFSSIFGSFENETVLILFKKKKLK
jgi:hypothetical protein